VLPFPSSPIYGGSKTGDEVPHRSIFAQLIAHLAVLANRPDHLPERQFIQLEAHKAMTTADTFGDFLRAETPLEMGTQEPENL
jgi:hypothetical protein